MRSRTLSLTLMLCTALSLSLYSKNVSMCICFLMTPYIGACKDSVIHLDLFLPLVAEEVFGVIKPYSMVQYLETYCKIPILNTYCK